ncbi:MAG: serine hydrolase [Chitinophagales bacterium]|nr:serine hydrolase [Chitinophagales bacterium]
MVQKNYFRFWAYLLLLVTFTAFGQTKSGTVPSTTQSKAANQPIYKGSTALESAGTLSEPYIKENGKNIPISSTKTPTTTPKAGGSSAVKASPKPATKTATPAKPTPAKPTPKPTAKSTTATAKSATASSAASKNGSKSVGGFDKVTGMYLEMPDLPANFKVTDATSLGVIVEDTDVPNLTAGEKNQLIKIQRLLRSASYLDEFSGVVIVAKDFKPIWKHAGGYANLDYAINTSLDARFNTCTISESFTATAILQLVQQNKINLQTPVKTYLPYMKGVAGNLTIHQLLSHTTALPDYYQKLDYANNFFNIKKVDELVQQIDQQTHQTITDKHTFTHSDYVVLGAVIEAVSGTTYKNYIYEKMLQPAGMELSDLYSWYDVIENCAVGYGFNAIDSLQTKRRLVKKVKRSIENKEVFQSAEYWGAHPFGADGIYATGDDLIRFLKSLLNNQLLTKDYTDLLFKNHSLKGDSIATNEEKYGYGWFTKTANGQTVLYQGGTLDAISVQIRHYVEDNYTIVVLSNYYINRAESIADKIEKAIYNTDYIVPVEPIGYAINESINTEGILYVANNFDTILKEKHLVLDKHVVLNKLAEDYMREKNYLTALEILKLNVSKFPNEPMVYDALATCYFEMGQYDNSLREYRKKLSLKANDPRATGMINHINTLQSKSK